MVVAIDPLKSLETLDLSTGENEKKATPDSTWEKALNVDKRFWFLEEVEQASEAIDLLADVPESGKSAVDAIFFWRIYLSCAITVKSHNGAFIKKL